MTNGWKSWAGAEPRIRDRGVSDTQMGQMAYEGREGADVVGGAERWREPLWNPKGTPNTMIIQRRKHAAEKPRAKHMLLGVLAVLGLFATTIDGTIAGADETGTCGEFNFGFSGTNLINDGISDSAGPFPVVLPAGTYDVTLRGEDDHSTSEASDQPGEQWYVALDNGWQSDLSNDIPDDMDTSTTTFTGVTIEAATAISVHHAGEGNVNSLRVVCVGFTTSGSAANAAADDCASNDNEMVDESVADEDGTDESEPEESGPDDAVADDAVADESDDEESDTDNEMADEDVAGEDETSGSSSLQVTDYEEVADEAVANETADEDVANDAPAGVTTCGDTGAADVDPADADEEATDEDVTDEDA